MSCYICGMRMDDIKLDANLEIRPCGTCEQVIQECIDGYETKDSGEYPYIESTLEEYLEEIGRVEVESSEESSAMY